LITRNTQSYNHSHSSESKINFCSIFIYFFWQHTAAFWRNSNNNTFFHSFLLLIYRAKSICLLFDYARNGYIGYTFPQYMCALKINFNISVYFMCKSFNFKIRCQKIDFHLGTKIRSEYSNVKHAYTSKYTVDRRSYLLLRLYLKKEYAFFYQESAYKCELMCKNLEKKTQCKYLVICSKRLDMYLVLYETCIGW